MQSSRPRRFLQPSKKRQIQAGLPRLLDPGKRLRYKRLTPDYSESAKLLRNNFRGYMRILKTALLAFIISLGAFAQTDRGTITGTVSDPAGAVVANAVV